MSLEWKLWAGDPTTPTYWSLKGPLYEITIEPRPSYCDRGNWLAKLFPAGKLARDIDEADLWPRYYFDLDRAKAECEAWVKKRGLHEH